MKMLIGFLIVISCPFSGFAESGDGISKSFKSGDKQVALLELFSSEGCSSCPPAERAVYHLRRDPGLFKSFVPLAFHVSYWNDLGWIDRLSDEKYTKRQHSYASEWRSANVYTPAFVLNGRESRSPLLPSLSELASNSPGELEVDVKKKSSMTLKFHPSLKESGKYFGHLSLLGNEIESRVTSGENTGATLRHNFVVLSLDSAPLSKESGDESYSAELPWPELKDVGAKGLSVAAWVTQDGSMRPIQAVGGDL